MKRISAILAITIYLLGATDANQLLKIPFMVNHFIGHHQQNPSLTLAGFINMHYINPVIDNDHEQDMKLPFKTHNEDGCMISAISMPILKFEVELPAIPNAPVTYTSMEANPYCFQPMATIFQPPRIV